MPNHVDVPEEAYTDGATAVAKLNWQERSLGRATCRDAAEVAIDAAAPAITAKAIEAERERLRDYMRSDDFVREARRRFGHPADPVYAERFRVFIDAAFDTLAALDQEAG